MTDDLEAWLRWARELGRPDAASPTLMAAVGSRVHALTKDAAKARAAALSATSAGEIERIVRLVDAGAHAEALAALGAALGPRPAITASFGWKLPPNFYRDLCWQENRSDFWQNWANAETCSAILAAGLEEPTAIGIALWNIADRLSMEGDAAGAMATGRLAVHTWRKPDSSAYKACVAWLALVYARSGRMDDGLCLLNWIIWTVDGSVELLGDHRPGAGEYRRVLDEAVSILAANDILTGAAHALHGSYLNAEGETASAESLGKAVEILKRHPETSILARLVRDLGRPQMEVLAYDRARRRGRESDQPALLEQASRALVNKGTALERLGRSEEAIFAYAEVSRRFGRASDAALVEQVTRALIRRAAALGRLERWQEEIDVYDEIRQRFGDTGEPSLKELLSDVLIDKGVKLAELGRSQEATEIIDEFRAPGGDATGGP